MVTIEPSVVENGLMSTNPAPPTDGRRARRDSNREVVLDAVLELFGEGVVNPTPEIVAARVGLSPRSVYRYVASRDDLLRAAIDRHVARLTPLLALDAIGQGPLAARVAALIEQRLALYAAVAQTNPVSRALALRNEVIAARLAEGMDVLREQVANHFAPELQHLPVNERRATLDALDALVQIETLHYFTATLGRSSRETRELLSRSLLSLLERKPT